MSKIRIKMGLIEIEYEGEDAFIKEDLLSHLEKVVNLMASKPAQVALQSSQPESNQNREANKGGTDWSVSDFATKFQVKTGADLVIAAAAKLTFSDGLESFDRAQLIESMKAGTGYYKETYVSNLTNTLTRLVKADKLRDLGGGKYSLSAGEKDRIGKLL
jgi:hypothetical protein